MMNRKTKPIRSGIEMAAMGSLPFILLGIILLCGRPKTWYNSGVDLPTAHTFSIREPIADMSTLVLKNGLCSFRVEGEDIRAMTLDKMSKKYGIVFAAKEVETFAKMGFISTSINGMKSLLQTPPNVWEIPVQSPGVSFLNEKNYELFDWIRMTRIACAELHNSDSRFQLFCDKNEPFVNVNKLMAILKSQHIHHIQLVYFDKGFFNKRNEDI